jgi:hypothetical protein
MNGLSAAIIQGMLIDLTLFPLLAVNLEYLASFEVFTELRLRVLLD